jgi:hypothetical protein
MDLIEVRSKQLIEGTVRQPRTFPELDRCRYDLACLLWVDFVAKVVGWVGEDCD